MTTSTDTMDLIDRKILNVIQTRFPLAEEPFAAIGEEVDIPEEEVLERIGELKSKNVVRQISAIFDTRRLGYKTTLVAMRFAPDELDAAAQVINEHPGVSHNYERNGHFNLWFTVAVPPYEELAETVENMANRTGAESYRMMPTIKFFKIGVNFDMVKEEGAAKKYYSPDGYNRSGAVAEDWNKAMPVSDFEIEVIRELQEDVELTSRPFSPDGGATRHNAAGVVRHCRLFPGARTDAALQRGSAPSPSGIPFKCDGGLESAVGALC